MTRLTHRRDSNDKQWQIAKEAVIARDRVDRIFRILSAQEAIILKKKAGSLLNYLDPAHIIPVSAAASIMYFPCNIVLLNRYSHEMLDSCKDPILGNNITKEEVNKWWLRILKGNPLQYEEFKKMLVDNNIYFKGMEL